MTTPNPQNAPSPPPTARWGAEHGERDRRGARFVKAPSCDACGKSIGKDRCTDGEVCGGGDGPGFYICSRVRCAARLNDLTVEQRRTLYTAQRNKKETP